MKIQNPFILTIFGASGDLAKLKIFPSIYELMINGQMPQDFYIIGYARSQKTSEEFRNEFQQSIRNHYVKIDRQRLDQLLSHVHYYSGQYDSYDDFYAFKEYLNNFAPNPIHLAYFSVPPIVFKSIIKNLGEHFKDVDTRLIIEKPFGNDAKSATELFEFVNSYFDQNQIYLLDHYLGKFAVQQIFNLRASNEILRLLVNSKSISNIQINALEDIGVTNRIGYFDQVGMIKDLMQSHLLQILALLSVSIPTDLSIDNLKLEKSKLLESLSFTPDSQNVSIGQYESYLSENGVPKNSITETFGAVKLNLSYKEWNEVPIFIRTGKKLHSKRTYVAIEYKAQNNEDPNRLIINIQPNPYIEIQLSKGHGKIIRLNDMTDIDGTLSEHAILFIDVINKNQSNFLSFPEILASWKLMDNLTAYISKANIPLEKYVDNSSGPLSSNNLMENKFQWYEINI